MAPPNADLLRFVRSAPLFSNRTSNCRLHHNTTPIDTSAAASSSKWHRQHAGHHITTWPLRSFYYQFLAPITAATAEDDHLDSMMNQFVMQQLEASRKRRRRRESDLLDTINESWQQYLEGRSRNKIFSHSDHQHLFVGREKRNAPFIQDPSCKWQYQWICF